MFCSTICRENAFFMYHKHECYNKCVELEYPQYSRVMRLFYFALYLFDDKIKDLKAFILSRLLWTTNNCQLELNPCSQIPRSMA